MTQEIKSKLDGRKSKLIRKQSNDNYSSTAKYAVDINGLIYTVLSNLRTKPNDFKANYHCTLCDPKKEKYNSKLIELHTSKIKLCCTCLTDMIIAINTSTLNECKRERQ